MAEAAPKAFMTIEPSAEMTYNVAPLDTDRRTWLSNAILWIDVRSGNDAEHCPVPANVLRMPFASTFRMTQVVGSAKYSSPAWLNAMGPGLSSQESRAG